MGGEYDKKGLNQNIFTIFVANFVAKLPEKSDKSLPNMRRRLILILVLLGLGLFPTELLAQIPQYDPVTGEVYDPLGEPKDYRTPEEIAADEAAAAAGQDTVEVKIKQPLLSYYFNDSIRSTKFFAWKVNTLFNSVEMTPIDSLLNAEYQIDYPYQRIDGGIGSISLGNYGSATMPIDYFSRSTSTNFSFLDVWRENLMTPEKTVFYNTRTPYSRLTYSMSGDPSEEETLFNILLTHNVSPSLSVNVNYNGDQAKGLYINQNTLTTNLGVSAAYTGKKFAIHGGIILNDGSLRENGGIVDDRLITDTIISEPNQIDVVLQDAINTYKGTTIWWTANYAIPLREASEDEITLESIPSIYIGNSFNYSQFERTYEATGDTSLYSTAYFDQDYTLDRVSQSMVDTRFFVQIQPYDRNGIVGLISAGLGTELSTYNQNVAESVAQSINFGGDMERSTLYAYGDIDGQISRYVEWDADARLNLLGYRIGDLDINGNIKLSAFTKANEPMTLDGSVRFTVREPDFWMQNYYSNHFIWNNNFEKEVSTRLSAKLSIDPLQLKLGVDYELTQNKLYYDANMLPAQFSGQLNVLGAYFQKDFTIGGLNLYHRVLMQLSSNETVAPVPLASAYVNYFYDLDVVKDVLKLQMGIEGRYQTKYYGFGYNPALAQFYNQREVEVGGFPYLDAYVAAKWKRLRILVKFQNWNIGLIGGRDYFMVAHYPQNPAMLKFKFSWAFYD